jgi:hypothetical protein
VDGVVIPRLLGDLRRVVEQVTRLLGDLSRLVSGLEQGSRHPALTAALHDLRSAVDELVPPFGELSRLVEALADGDLLERARAIVEAQKQDENQVDKKEGPEAQNLSDLRRLVKRLEELAAPKGRRREEKNQEGKQQSGEPALFSSPDDRKMGDVNDLIIKTDGQIDSVLVGWGSDKKSALKLARFKVTPQPGGRVRVMLSAKEEAIQRALEFLKPAVEQTEALPDRSER